MDKIIRPIEDIEAEAAENNPDFKAALEKKKSLIERASLNEAIKVIDELLEELETATLAQRFSRTRKMKENQNRLYEMMQKYEGMTEEEFKKTQLRRDLESLKDKIAKDIGDMGAVIMDLEASKLD